jgi:hypothetical protein
MNDIIHKIKGYLGYGVEIEYLHYFEIGVLAYRKMLNMDDVNIFKIKNSRKNQFRLILRPLEDLTIEEINSLNETIIIMDKRQIGRWCNIVKSRIEEKTISLKSLDFFHKNHIDYLDLIGQGLAIKKEIENGN